MATKILERCLALDPSISSDGTLSGIKGHNVGLRPGRRGGPRLERQEVPISSKAGSLNPIFFGESEGAKGKGSVVHAYGLAGAGYQTSWGVEKELGQLVDDHFAVQAKAKL
ncbi:D-amino-acid oxidase [Pseudohyphozyma bogoriensis]|nr:D-amino-acid oxidase [Pseudohyphozyma bogoriensis]